MSADEVLECSRAFRDHYCKSVMLAACDRDMFRLANISNSNAVTRILYSLLLCPDSKGQMFSFERRQHLLFLAAASIAYLTALPWFSNSIIKMTNSTATTFDNKDEEVERKISSSVKDDVVVSSKNDIPCVESS